MREIETQSPETPLMFFDIDGTLAEGYAILSFAEYLADRDLIDPEAWKKMKVDTDKWASSQKADDDYREFATNLVDHYALGLKGRSQADIIMMGEVFFDSVKAGESSYKIFDYSLDLVRMLGQHGRTIAVSGSPLESLNPLINHLGIDDLRATESEVIDGIFTGRIIRNMAVDEAKASVVKEMKDIGYDKSKSFAFGDSPHDSPLLRAVDSENAFMMGVNPSLKAMGEEFNWTALPDSADVLSIVGARVYEVFGGED